MKRLIPALFWLLAPVALAAGPYIWNGPNAKNLTSNGTLNPDGVVGTPSYSFINDTDVGIYRPSTNTLGIVTAGLDRITVDGSGNVGIGTSPSFRLDVLSPDNSTNSFVQFLANNGTVGLGFDFQAMKALSSNTNSDLSILAKGASGSIWLGHDTDVTGVRVSADDTANTLWFGARSAAITADSGKTISIGKTSVAGTTGLTVETTTGKVGIGTASPGAQLEADVVSSSTIGTIIKGAASQSANLQEWQNSTGSIKGRFSLSSFATYAGLTIENEAVPNLRLVTNSTTAGEGPSIFMGDAASSNRWQFFMLADTKAFSFLNRATGGSANSFGHAVYVDASNRVEFGAAAGISGYLALTLTDQVLINTRVNSYKGLVVRAASGQSVNLQEWQDSSSVGMSAVTADGRLGVGTVSPAASAAVDITSTTGALILPRMTTTQRDALTAVNGMQIYNSTTDKMQLRVAGAWVDDTTGTPLTNPMTTTGDIIYSSDGSGTPARLGIGASTTVLHGGTTPSYSAVSLPNDTTGVLTMAKGGTNKNATAVNGGLVWSDADSMEITSAGTASDWILSGGAGTPTMSSTTTTAKVIDGSADAIQLTVQGHSTQTNDIFVAEKSDGTDYLSVSGTGNVTVPNGTLTEAFTDATTNSASQTVVGLTRQTSGTAAAGLGAQMLLSIEDSSGANDSAAITRWEWSNATNGAEASKYSIWTRTAGGALTKGFEMDGSSNVTLLGTTATTGLILNGGSTLSTFVEGSWSPNPTKVANLTGSETITKQSYTRVGKTIYFQFRISGYSVTTALSTRTVFTFSLPVALTTSGDPVGGNCEIGGASEDYGQIFANGGTAAASWRSTQLSGAVTIDCTGQYAVL